MIILEKRAKGNDLKICTQVIYWSRPSSMCTKKIRSQHNKKRSVVPLNNKYANSVLSFPRPQFLNIQEFVQEHSDSIMISYHQRFEVVIQRDIDANNARSPLLNK
jgi:hypothetical protein